MHTIQYLVGGVHEMIVSGCEILSITLCSEYTDDVWALSIATYHVGELRRITGYGKNHQDFLRAWWFLEFILIVIFRHFGSSTLEVSLKVQVDFKLHLVGSISCM